MDLSTGWVKVEEQASNEQNPSVTARLDSALPDTQWNLSSQISFTNGSRLLTKFDLGLPDTQCDRSSAQISNYYHHNSDPQLPNTQRFTTQLPESEQNLQSPLLLDDLLPDTQRAVQSQLSKYLPKSLLDIKQPCPQGSTDNAKHFNNNLLHDAKLPKTGRKDHGSGTSPIHTRTCNLHLVHTQGEIHKSETSVESFDRLDSQLPVTQRYCEDFGESSAKPHLITTASSVIHVPSSLLPDTQEGIKGVGSWIVNGESDIAMQFLATQPIFSRAITEDHTPTENISHTSSSTIAELQSSLPLSTEYLNPNSTPSKDNSTNLNPLPLSASSPTSQKVPINKLSIRERKRIVVSAARSPNLTAAMRLWHKNTSALLDPFRLDSDCWLHPSPPRAHLSLNGILRPHGKLQKAFIWQDFRGRHSLVLNFGIVTKLIYHDLSKQQQDGFINKQWHLSHLCGNWVCTNPKHTTVEPGMVNISRNNCFSHRSGCLHDPPCMKDLKIALGADGKPIDHNASVASNYEVRAEGWDDWSVRSMDGEESMVLDDDEEGVF